LLQTLAPYGCAIVTIGLVSLLRGSPSCFEATIFLTPVRGVETMASYSIAQEEQYRSGIEAHSV
jgi:hypothetical protein